VNVASDYRYLTDRVLLATGCFEFGANL